jgi:2-polyprenyl-6-methoxyphenol hydroxylase-like FAD-dependent oxidoreductase
LNNALKDVSEIVDALSQVCAGTRTLEDAIEAYEAEMIPRGALEVSLSFDLANKRANAKYEDRVVLLGWEKPGPTA